MTRITRLSILTAVTAAGAFLAPAFSIEAVAQITISVPGITRSYYDGYSTYRPGVGQYGYSGYPYTGYGAGPYGYRSAIPYGYPAFGGNGYRSGRSYSIDLGGSYLRSRTLRRVYVPPTTRYYSPYGYGYRG